MAVEPAEPHDQPAATLALRMRAFSVHVFTALGAVLGLLALSAAIEGIWTDVFFWLALAALVDAADGPFARRFAVAHTLPRWSGDVLDLVVDYVNYVFVPAVALALGGILPTHLALPAAALVLVTGAIYFADRRMKTEDAYFLGFPAAWNLVAYYLFLLRPDPILALAIVLVLCALTFVPLAFVHPLRVQRHRTLNFILLAIWIALGAVSLAYELSPPAPVTYALVALALYFLSAGLLRQPRERSRE
jgi:phosphatidylcholine synthase